MNATTRTALSNELTTLRAAIATHHARIALLIEKRDDLEIAFTETFGFDPRLSLDNAVGFAAVSSQIESMNDEDGYFWAQSRARDLEVILNSGRLVTEGSASWSTANVWGIGDMPKANESVGSWICGVFGLSVAA